MKVDDIIYLDLRRTRPPPVRYTLMRVSVVSLDKTYGTDHASRASAIRRVFGIMFDKKRQIFSSAGLVTS